MNVGALIGIVIAILLTRLIEVLPAPPRRFSLRTLLLAMTAAAIFFGTIAATMPR